MPQACDAETKKLVFNFSVQANAARSRYAEAKRSVSARCGIVSVLKVRTDP